MHFFLKLTLILLICSCQVARKRKQELSIVDLNNQYSKPVVTSQNSDENIYGPIGVEQVKQLDKDSSGPVIGLELSPALYNSLAYIELLDQLGKRKIKPQILITSGFSTIIAALFLKYESSNRINFKMFSLMSKLIKEEVYSKAWQDKILTFLEDEFGDTKQESYKSLLIIPQYKNKKISLVYTGKIKDNIRDSLNLNQNQTNFLLRPNIGYRNEVNNLGVDLVFKFSSLSSESKLNSPSGFLWGVFSKIKGFSLYEANGFKTINVKNRKIDKVTNIIDLMKSAKPDASLEANIIENIIQQWTEEKGR